MVMSNGAPDDLSNHTCITEMGCLESILTTKLAHNMGSARAIARHALQTEATRCEIGSNRCWLEGSAEHAKWNMERASSTGRRGKMSIGTKLVCDTMLSKRCAIYDRPSSSGAAAQSLGSGIYRRFIGSVQHD